MGNAIFQSNDCTVCLEQYTDTNYPACLPCGHIICFRCSQLINLCPADRKSFTQAEVRRIYNSGEEVTAEQQLQSVADRLKELETRNEELVAHKIELEARNRLLQARLYRVEVAINWTEEEDESV